MRKRIDSESGFTLIELLVVILIIGVLAAIALPTFLGQQDKAKDAGAKSDVRNLASHVDSCFTTEQTYTNCTSTTQLGNTGLNLVNGAPAKGQVAVTGATQNSYTITAVAPSGTNFTLARDLQSGTTRQCSPSNTGGCLSGGSW